MRKTILSIAGGLLIAAGALLAMTATLITFILPPKFASTTRVLPAVTGQAALATETQNIQSRAVLSQVASNLNLSKRWGEKFKESELPASVTESLLRLGLTVKQVRGTSLIEIRVESDTPEEAAEIANQVADVYRASPLAPPGTAGKPGVAVTDMARPNPRPAKPNKVLNIVSGCALGAVVGAIGLLLIVLGLRKAGNPART